MRLLAHDVGLSSLIAPVRPTLKAKYPLIPIDDYVAWRTDDGHLFDPWLRVHERIGATMIGVASESMRISGSGDDWKTWTGLTFSTSGQYVDDGALAPVTFDEGADEGVYVESNVWMHHRLQG